MIFDMYKYIEPLLEGVKDFELPFITKLNKKLKNKNPISLLSYMRDFKYGWVINGKLQNDNDNLFFDKYKLMQPDLVYKYKAGVCQDQALFEYYVLTKWGYKCQLIFLQHYKSSTHTYLVFNSGDKLYHFENSFDSYRGIHGPYADYNSIAEDVYSKMVELDKKKLNKNTDFGYMYKKIDYSKLIGFHDISWVDYCKICGYDFSK